MPLTDKLWLVSVTYTLGFSFLTESRITKLRLTPGVWQFPKSGEKKNQEESGN